MPIKRSLVPERTLTFALSKVTHGRSEFLRQMLLRLLADLGVFKREYLSDPLALYSQAMESERCFLAALVLQEEILGIEEYVSRRLTINAVQAAVTKAALDKDMPLLKRLQKSFPEFGITQDDATPANEGGDYIELAF